MTDLETRKDVIDWYISECHQIAADKGWWRGNRSPIECLALVHSEVSEAVEELRKPDHEGSQDAVATELADVLIRIFDMCGMMTLPLGDALEKKIEFNRTRPYRHGGKLA